MQHLVVIVLTVLIPCSFSSKVSSSSAKPVIQVSLLEELPKASLRVSSTWKAKIPDIEDNLALARQWMTMFSASNTTGINGTIMMFAGGVSNGPLYHKCGLAMNTAWGAMSRNPCSNEVWDASDKMKSMMPECSWLDDGEKYKESYRALLIDQDRWCGGLRCNPPCSVAGDCRRDHAFPFEPHCESYATNDHLVKEAPLQKDPIQLRKDPIKRSPFTGQTIRSHSLHSSWWLVLVLCLLIIFLVGGLIVRHDKVPRASRQATPPTPPPTVIHSPSVQSNTPTDGFALKFSVRSAENTPSKSPRNSPSK